VHGAEAVGPNGINHPDLWRTLGAHYISQRCHSHSECSTKEHPIKFQLIPCRTLFTPNGVDIRTCSAVDLLARLLLLIHDDPLFGVDMLPLHLHAVPKAGAHEVAEQDQRLPFDGWRFCYEEDVPIFIPGVSLDHAALLAAQRKNRNWCGCITPVPNCTTMGLAMPLKPLQAAFGIRMVLMTSLQACSGAG
jgi:hypothetical protein